MSIKKEYYQKLANTVLKAFEKRFMEGHYCETIEEAKELALSFVTEGSKVSFGGSVTLEETGVLAELRAREDITLYDRATATTPEENKQIMHDALSCDYYFMSSNAITLDGQLVNIDGSGNRVACLAHGPKNVVIVAGVNKVVKDVDAAIDRVQNIASPPNAIRLGLNLPCAKYGRCVECLDQACMCCQTVITRKSRIPGRIKVILVGEELGF